MGWGEKAIEIRSVETGHLDGVFMHKRAQRLKFLCERNDKVMCPGASWCCSSLQAVVSPLWGLGMNFLAASVSAEGTLWTPRFRRGVELKVPSVPRLSQVFFASVRSGGSSQVYFMTLGRTSLLSW